MTSLDDVFATGKLKARGCAVCGGPTGAMVQVRLMELESGRVSKGGRSLSKGRSYCAEHAAEVFAHLVSEAQGLEA